MHVKSELQSNLFKKLLDKLFFMHVVPVRETEKGFHLPYLITEVE